MQGKLVAMEIVVAMEMVVVMAARVMVVMIMVMVTAHPPDGGDMVDQHSRAERLGQNTHDLCVSVNVYH